MGLNPEQLQYVARVRALLFQNKGFELRPQVCFLNAMALAVGDHCLGQHRIQYCEGHLTLSQHAREALGVTQAPHAWVTVDGNLYDPTEEVNRRAKVVPEEEYRAEAYEGEPVPLDEVLKLWDKRVAHPINPALRKENQDLIRRQSEKAQQSKPTDSADQPKQGRKAQ